MPDTSEMVMDVTPLLGLEVTWVRSVVGQLQFLATMVRYDISHAVSRLSQYSHTPTEGSRKALCRILGYLMTTVEYMDRVITLQYTQTRTMQVTKRLTHGAKQEL